MVSEEIALLFEKAKQHLIEHACSAHPYQYFQQLYDMVEDKQPGSILEIGTGCGFTAAVMALAAPPARITTIDKDAEHIVVAKKLFIEKGVFERVQAVEAIGEQYLPASQDQFDLIFFDGYGIHYEFLPQYRRLLTKSGLAIIANNQLTTKTSDQFFAELQDTKKWHILKQFGDTTVAQKVS